MDVVPAELAGPLVIGGARVRSDVPDGSRGQLVDLSDLGEDE